MATRFWARMFGFGTADRGQPPAGTTLDNALLDDSYDLDDDYDPESSVEVAITDVLDLHSFRPAEVKDVVRDYLDAAYDLGLRELRIIHGRGIGVQRKTVQTLLDRDPRVVDYSDAPPDGGGWGATVVRMK